MKKAFLVISVCIILSNFYYQPVSSPFSEVWVDDSFTDVNEDIDGDTYFKTIPAAVAAVNESGIINVAPGTYTGQITLTKSGLTLRSVGGAAVTTIDFTGVWCGYWSTGAGGIDIPYGVNNTTVEGFTIVGGSPASDALVSIGGDNNVISNNIVIGDLLSAGQDIGIHIGDVAGTSDQLPSGNKIVDNEVYNHTGSGIFVGNWAGINNIISGNDVHDCVVGGIPALNGNGIEVDRALSVAITDNTVHDNEVAGIRVVRTAPDAVIKITFNTITGNDAGVRSENWRPGAPGSAVVSITCNNIANNTSYGVLNTVDALIGAEHNWWGDITGPYHVLMNPGGAGDTVSDNVNVVPWGSVPDPCALREAPSEKSPVFGRKVCPLADYNIHKAEDMLVTVEGLLDDAHPLDCDTSNVEELVEKAKELLEMARIFCKQTQNCIAGNTLAVEAQTLLEEAIELLESLLE